MIQVTVLKNYNGQFTGFSCCGHSGYANIGKDIVCAGVSALVINTINSISAYTNEKISVESYEDTGMILLQFLHPAGHDAELLVKSLILGLQGIQQSYGADYIDLDFKEVLEDV